MDGVACAPLRVSLMTANYFLPAGEISGRTAVMDIGLDRLQEGILMNGFDSHFRRPGLALTKRISFEIREALYGPGQHFSSYTVSGIY